MHRLLQRRQVVRVRLGRVVRIVPEPMKRVGGRRSRDASARLVEKAHAYTQSSKVDSCHYSQRLLLSMSE